jgi:hypothetical protein
VSEDMHDNDRRTLHALGYAQELRRGMSGFSNFAISFTIISILSGTLTLYGTGLNYGGPIEEAYGWPLVSVFVIIVGLGMAEIASKYPTAGGLYYWASKMGGPGWGWFTGWFNLIGQIAITAGIDYGAAVFADALLEPALAEAASTEHSTEIIYVYAVILALHALMNIFSVKLVAFLNDVSVWWHVIGGRDHRRLPHLQADPPSVVRDRVGQDVNNSGFSHHSWLLVRAAARLLQAQYTFTGYDASAHMSEETQGASRSAARGVIMSIVVSAIFGYILALGVTFAIQDLHTTASGGHLRGEAGVPRRARDQDGRGDALHHGRRTALLRHELDHVGLADDVRVLARRRNTGPQALAPAERPARPRLRGGGDRRARVPLRLPGLLRHKRRRRLRGGHLDRHDRALHRLRDPDLPEVCARATPGSRASGISVAGTRPVGVDRRVWVAFISVLFILPTVPDGIPFKHGFTWLDVNYAIIAVIGTLLLVGGWWVLSARKWFKGPISQGSEEDLAQIEQGFGGAPRGCSGGVNSPHSSDSEGAGSCRLPPRFVGGTAC